MRGEGGEGNLSLQSVKWSQRAREGVYSCEKIGKFSSFVIHSYLEESA